MFDLYTDSITAGKNLKKQGTKVLHAIVESYCRGTLDDPRSAEVFCGLLAAICEGKVRGALDQETESVLWSLTPEYQEHLDLQAEALASRNVVQGPWS